MSSETVDDIMARCPLKQEVRETLWACFARKVAGEQPLARYLTLYSPPMMDLKHFHRSGLLGFDGESYRGVIAVTYDKTHYAQAMARTSGRPELLLYGDINVLLTQEDTADAKRLRKVFPIQVLNLDYTNALFSEVNKLPVSDHLAAIDEVIRLQQRHKAEEFVLFITTRAERNPRSKENEFSPGFLKELADRVDANLAGNQPFEEHYSKAFGEINGGVLLQDNYEAFIPIGLSKLIAQMLAQHSFELLETGGCMLVRDDRLPARWLLHLAFHVKSAVPPRARSLRTLGRTQFFLERRVADVVELVVKKKLPWIHVSGDGKRLAKKHSAYVAELASQTLDLSIPEPTKREAK